MSQISSTLKRNINLRIQTYYLLWIVLFLISAIIYTLAIYISNHGVLALSIISLSTLIVLVPKFEEKERNRNIGRLRR